MSKQSQHTHNASDKEEATPASSSPVHSSELEEEQVNNLASSLSYMTVSSSAQNRLLAQNFAYSRDERRMVMQHYTEHSPEDRNENADTVLRKILREGLLPSSRRGKGRKYDHELNNPGAPDMLSFMATSFRDHIPARCYFPENVKAGEKVNGIVIPAEVFLAKELEPEFFLVGFEISHSDATAWEFQVVVCNKLTSPSDRAFCEATFMPLDVTSPTGLIRFGSSDGRWHQAWKATLGNEERYVYITLSYPGTWSVSGIQEREGFHFVLSGTVKLSNFPVDPSELYWFETTKSAP